MPVMPEMKLRADLRNKSLLHPNLTWEAKVTRVLHMIRCQELFEYNTKLYDEVPTSFCAMNIAFFDLDKESEVKHGPLLGKIPASRFRDLDDSVNVISIKVAESDVGYPINVYGTVLARDQNDYRCVYLFNRGRDDPQLITSTDDMLTLTGPYRALSGMDCMYFEFHLKIKGKGSSDEVFSIGLKVRNAVCDGHCESCTSSLKSYRSKIDMVYTPVPSALQASLGVDILNAESSFSGKITAWTTGIESRIILYDSDVADTETKVGEGGYVSLTRSIVAVYWEEALQLEISVGALSCELVLWHESSVEEHACHLAPYELQVKIVWTGVYRQVSPKMWKEVNHIRVLW
uniref:DUF6598 domain-containing protein n=1 Tax=Arundo donax TaxID=35708 RepID=A0A0A8ZHD8_ARUDO